ncbi:MAG: hypothetical protein SVU32_01250, partial [Candidatus Nanohaloarchaea archaeon]|nr:hypothetical protein [Candidatus Nanohaloarchaea archaeon]
MRDTILFFLLEGPKSISDMIRELTEKELSEYADKRQDQIPRIAGNWFRDGGYISELREEGLIKDTGRQYAINKWSFTDRFVEQAGILQQFPEH